PELTVGAERAGGQQRESCGSDVDRDGAVAAFVLLEGFDDGAGGRSGVEGLDGQVHDCLGGRDRRHGSGAAEGGCEEVDAFGVEGDDRLGGAGGVADDCEGGVGGDGTFGQSHRTGLPKPDVVLVALIGADGSVQGDLDRDTGWDTVQYL